MDRGLMQRNRALLEHPPHPPAWRGSLSWRNVFTPQTLQTQDPASALADATMIPKITDLLTPTALLGLASRCRLGKRSPNLSETLVLLFFATEQTP